jgi:hypothetical protein
LLHGALLEFVLNRYISGVYVNIKHDKLYMVINVIINANNNAKCNETVIYKEIDDSRTYARDYDEFMEKFKKCDILPIKQTKVSDYEDIS